MTDTPKVAPRFRGRVGGRPLGAETQPRSPVTQHIIDTTVGFHEDYMGEDGAYAALPLNLRRAVDVLVLGGTGKAAAIAAGYTGADSVLFVRGHTIRRKPEVIAAVIEREAVAMEEAGLTLYRSWLRPVALPTSILKSCLTIKAI